MNFSKLTPYFTLTNSQRKGILLLFAIIITVQLLFMLLVNPVNREQVVDAKWLSVQTEIDSLKQVRYSDVPKIYPYNPNFITDFIGYKLGMSVVEIDRLLLFRKSNKYVNSAAEFQAVTKVSDSLLSVMSPYFKFPDWVKNKKNFTSFDKKQFTAKVTGPLIDINNASAEDLIKIYGIGPALSERILKQKDLLGGFVSMNQMQDIWGLSLEVIDNLNKKFTIIKSPEINKISINKATIKELSQFPYFRYPISKNIVTYRSMNGDIKSTADLIKIKGFPAEKIDIIAVYLEF